MTTKSSKKEASIKSMASRKPIKSVKSTKAVKPITKKLTTNDILRILGGSKQVKKLTLSEGSYRHLPKRVLKSLKKIGVIIDVVKLRRGPPTKVDIGAIHRFYNAELRAEDIAKRTHIPLRTVYYHLRKIRRSEEKVDEEN